MFRPTACVILAALAVACGSGDKHDQLFSSRPTGAGGGSVTGGGGSGSGGSPVVGGGGTAGGSSGPGGSSSMGGNPSSGNIDIIDDMEDGDASILAVGDRNGAWFSIHDETNGSLWPPSDSPFVMSPLPQVRGNSKTSVRANGSGYSTWGAAVGLMLKISEAKLPVPYDAGAYKGITFWARIGENSTSTLRVDFPDKNTAAMGGVCQGMMCNDHFGRSISMSQAWKQFSIDFAELKQTGFGMQQPALDAAHLLGIQFEFGKDAIFYVLIDDVAFYK